MKYHLLLSGIPVTYNKCLENLSNLNFDYQAYSHFWWNDDYFGKRHKLHFSEVVDINNFILNKIDNFKISDYDIQDFIKFETEPIEKLETLLWSENIEFYKVMHPLYIYGLKCQIYSLLEAIKKCDSLSDDDIIIRSRPDIEYQKRVGDVIEKIDFSKDRIYFQSSMYGGHLYAGEHPNRPCDWFFCGNKKTMYKFIQSLWNRAEKQQTKRPLHVNELMRVVCDENNIELVLEDFGAIIYKQTDDYYSKYHINVSTYFQNFDYEEMKVKNDEIWPFWIKNVDFTIAKNMII